MDCPMIQPGSNCNVLLTDEAHTHGLHWRRNEEPESQVDALDGKDIAGRVMAAAGREMRVPGVRAAIRFAS